MAFNIYRGDGKPPQGQQQVQRNKQPGRYIPDRDLVRAVNTALAVEQPLLLTGDPGTGKTELAWSVATELGLGPVLEFHTRSDHQAQHLLYTFDHLRRLYDAHGKDASAQDPAKYLTFQALGDAIRSPTRKVVLIDEIDKAPRDFPNDLLNPLDQMAFTVQETNVRFEAKQRPVVIITSNSERQLPDAFLRRCVFHYIAPPSRDQLKVIIQERLGHLQLSTELLDAALDRFLALRARPNMEKQPATAELLKWLLVLVTAGVSAQDLTNERDLSRLLGLGTLVKSKDDWLSLRGSAQK